MHTYISRFIPPVHSLPPTYCLFPLFPGLTGLTFPGGWLDWAVNCFWRKDGPWWKTRYYILVCLRASVFRRGLQPTTHSSFVRLGCPCSVRGPEGRGLIGVVTVLLCGRWDLEHQAPGPIFDPQ